MIPTSDPSLPNRHRLHVGTSGSGKSPRIRELLRTEKPAHVVAWDPDEDFPLTRRTRVSAFIRDLKGAAESKKAFRLALTCGTDPKAFEIFCGAVWEVRNPARPLVVIVDELAAVCRSVGKGSPNWSRLSSRGRKYGLILWAGTQRPQEIDKTIYGNVGALWCGRLKTHRDRKLLAEEMDVAVRDIAALGALEYLERWGAETPTFGKVKMR